MKPLKQFGVDANYSKFGIVYYIITRSLRDELNINCSNSYYRFIDMSFMDFFYFRYSNLKSTIKRNLYETIN